MSTAYSQDLGALNMSQEHGYSRRHASGITNSSN
jgi:hypothetical protein